MKKLTKPGFILTIVILCQLYSLLFSQELPRPSYDNSLILSFTYSLQGDSPSEVEYIKSQFGNGLYAPLTFSSFLGVEMDWYTNPSNAANRIQSFKNTIDTLVQKAKSHGVGIHIIITYGLSRGVTLYKSAKEEDIRNAQWFSDNNLASQSQLGATSEIDPERHDVIIDFNLLEPINDPGTSSQRQLRGTNDVPGMSTPMSSNVNLYVFTTFSRYARKLRNHLEAKARAAFDYLKQKQDENPDVHIIVSTPGEAEFNSLRQKSPPPLQEFFCDFSPYAVLEFRDWLKREGLYGSGEKYEGEEYTNGGSRYQGVNGLQNFNRDFGTNFTTWDLKYYHWSLSDHVDSNYTDSLNPDPNIIPFSDFTFDGMMPTSGPNYTAGGFDPPRVMLEEGENPFWDLWQTFRETMVHHLVKDIAFIARESGFDRDHYYTHQIPADYLWGTNPDDPNIPPNARYYSSASPLWTANAHNDMGVGVTLYDIHFTTHYVRTSQYIFPAISSMSNNWGAMEYNPEIVPSQDVNDINTVETIYQQIKRLYDYNVHVINFFVWQGNLKYQFKGNNRETAAKHFFDAVKDKARQSITTVFTPKEVENFTGQYNHTNGSIDLSWSAKIWRDLNHKWEDWGDFKEFVIYRGYTGDFQCNSSSEIARVTGYSYKDTGFLNATTVYYKIAALNVNGKRGNRVTSGVHTGNGGTLVLEVSRTKMNFGACTCGAVTPSQAFLIENTGSGVMTWSVTDNADWLSCNPVSGINSGKVEAAVDASGKSPGTYNRIITISAPGATGSPRTINVTLTVYSAGTDAVPFGRFETPVHNSTVRSSIPVTGWVLDDIGVESVKIYRKEGSKLLHLGDAVLVEGARPDVELAYPGYPYNYKAGWGYMMLTNFLPNQGNGTFTFHAIARDATGHQVTLGTKTITCDNANAVKPFGAIDTPTQGGEASGSKFINWGWALTPQPNAIPTNGSTINVYIDGAYIGHPVYNRYRKDIAAFFPGYANSNGAVGYFYLDTTAYANGVHTIAWSVRDNAGNVDGIGSRYFTIQNTGGNAGRTAQSAGHTAQSAERIAHSAEPVQIKKGYHLDSKPQRIYSGDKGSITINIKELERIEILLHEGTGGLAPLSECTGFLEVGSQLRNLPCGSSLDRKNGVFYWQPGLGYLGEYQVIFILREKTGKLTKKFITIKINPKY
ncbi:hypothetical protein ACFLRT_00750 [Acidobacteriota bacterium]